jgi:hypothetical protein
MQMNQPNATSLSEELTKLQYINNSLNELVLAQSVLIKEIINYHLDESCVCNKEIQELVKNIQLLVNPTGLFNKA